MKMVIKIIRGLGYVWVVLASLFIFSGIIGTFMSEGFAGVMDLLSPFNVTNYLITIITLAPGLYLLVWADKLQERKGKR